MESARFFTSPPLPFHLAAFPVHFQPLITGSPTVWRKAPDLIWARRMVNRTRRTSLCYQSEFYRRSLKVRCCLRILQPQRPAIPLAGKSELCQPFQRTVNRLSVKCVRRSGEGAIIRSVLLNNDESFERNDFRADSPISSVSRFYLLFYNKEDFYKRVLFLPLFWISTILVTASHIYPFLEIIGIL